MRTTREIRRDAREALARALADNLPTSGDEGYDDRRADTIAKAVENLISAVVVDIGQTIALGKKS